MHTNVNLAAPIGALAFLGTAFVIFVAALGLVYSFIAKKRVLRNYLATGILILAALYLGIVLIFSLASSDKVLARGQEKHFCEIDCHLAYSITNVSRTKTLGASPNVATASGIYYVVTIKTRFDETTISSTRGIGPLYPNSRVMVIVDENGNKYFPAADGQSALETTHAAGTPITTPLRPSETYMTTFVFDLPPDIKNPTLLIREGELVTHFVIGHENSPLHKKTRFQI